MKIFVLICTLDEGILRIPDMLLPEQEGVYYVVSWQRTMGKNEQTALKERKDVRLVTMEGRGLCRNRNHAIETALTWLDHPLEDAIFIIADDDEQLIPEAFDHLRDIYKRYPKMDGALVRLRSSADGQYFKTYPPSLIAYGRHPRSYYPCSWEMTFRTRIWQMGLRFDERFGLGSERLCAGEEDVLLTDITRKGLNILIVPEDIGYTNPVTTGSHLLNPKMLRSKGAVYGYQYSLITAWLRSLREALSLGWKRKVNPWPIFSNILFGVNYIRSCKKD
jgi:hypothetical protein